MLGLSENIVPSERHSEIADAENKRQLFAFALIRIERGLLLISPHGSSQWQVPFVEIDRAMQMESTLRRRVMDCTGVEILVGSLDRKVIDPTSGIIHCYFHCLPKAWSSRSLAALPRHPDYLVRLWPLNALSHGFALFFPTNPETGISKPRILAAPSTNREISSVDSFYQNTTCLS